MQISCTLTGVFFFFYKSKIIGGRLPSRLEEAKGETLRCSPRAEVGRICRSEKKAHTSQVESCTSLSTAATHHARCGWSQWRLKNNNLRVSFLFSSSLTCLKAEFVAAVLLFRSSLSASLSSSSPRCQLLFFFPSLLLRVPSAVETSFFTSHFSPTWTTVILLFHLLQCISSQTTASNIYIYIYIYIFFSIAPTEALNLHIINVLSPSCLYSLSSSFIVLRLFLSHFYSFFFKLV